MTKDVEKLRDANLALTDLKSRKDAIKKLALEHRDTVTDTDADKAIEEVRSVNDEIKSKEQEIEKIKNKNKDERSQKNMELEKIDINEKRDNLVKDFAKNRSISISNAETRSTLLASAGIAKPTKVNGISDPFNTQITILDQVKVIDMTGVGTFKESMLKSYSTAGVKADGTAQSESDPVFGSVTITSVNTGVLSYISDQIKKTTPLNYASKVQESALTALKVKLSNNIIAGIKTAQDDASVDLFQTLDATSGNGMLPTTTGVIDEKTLRNIAMNYGGDANVMGNAWLYLNKSDLIAFGDVRGTNEKKAVYEITASTVNPNIGTIKDGGLTVQYCIVPTLTKLSGTAQTTSAVQTMIYGSPMNYELALFGNYDIEVSGEYKFAEGLDTVKGQVRTGGNVIAYNGFEIVTIPANV